MEEHRIEIAKLSRALSVLPQQAAYTLVRLEVMQSHGDGPRRALAEAVRMIQNVLVLACSREVALVDLRERGIPVALRARLAQVCREAMGGATCDADALEALISRCGVAKHHLFCNGVKFSRRRAKRDKLP